MEKRSAVPAKLRSKQRLYASLYVAAVLIGCGGWLLLGADGKTERYPARATSRPTLWLVRTVGGRRDARPVRICLDDKLKAAVSALTADVGDVPCVPITRIDVSAVGSTYKCTVGAARFGVSTTVSASSARGFTIASSVVDLDKLTTAFARTLKYTSLGPCPSGWAIGEATDQQGRRVRAATSGRI